MWTLKARLCRAFCVHLVRVSVRLLEAVVAVPLEKNCGGSVEQVVGSLLLHRRHVCPFNKLLTLSVSFSGITFESEQ